MRVLFFVTLIAAGFILPWQLLVVGIGVYTFFYEGIEVLFLAFLFDAFAGLAVPWIPLPAVYTLATIGILVFVWGLKPLFLIESRM